MEDASTTLEKAIMTMIAGMEVTKAKIARTISEPVNPILNSLVKTQNVSLKPTNVMERMIVEMAATNLTVVSIVI